MKKTALLLIAISLCCTAFSQIKAVTETGDQVTLYNDGSWRYDDESLIPEVTEISINSTTFTKTEDASFLLKSTKSSFGLWLDPKTWNFTKESSNPEAEYELNMKSGDLYGMVISEKIEIPLEMMRGIAVDNARGAAPDIKIINEEYRMVNGLKMLHMEMHGTIQGMKFAYYGYYYSSEEGTIQIITFTSQLLMEDLKEDAETLLNGLVEVIEKE